jgi:hypothetical protein
MRSTLCDSLTLVDATSRAILIIDRERTYRSSRVPVRFDPMNWSRES